MRSPSSEARPGTEPAEAIHEARKDVKKIRSALRLVRHEIGDDVWRRENEHYREVARGLSGFRDAEILVQALDGLGSGSGRPRARVASTRCESSWRRRTARPTTTARSSARWPVPPPSSRPDGQDRRAAARRRRLGADRPRAPPDLPAWPKAAARRRGGGERHQPARAAQAGQGSLVPAAADPGRRQAHARDRWRTMRTTSPITSATITISLCSARRPSDAAKRSRAPATSATCSRRSTSAAASSSSPRSRSASASTPTSRSASPSGSRSAGRRWRERKPVAA